ncbi:MAG: prepilin-type N-terminal cleavage/methylation domain-containing protein, partial [Candidatus Komeilibacteria bacterium]|nr:prepilin-type N-terminal cleavage/methylation domain-containing protein [Candidatus Komeilibacteria bacterium]
IRHNQAGITLIEILISITLLTVGILGIIRVFPQGLSAEKNIELGSIAEQLGQAKIEELTALDYDSLSTGTLENQVRIGSDASSPFYNFKRSTAVDLVDANLNSTAIDVGLKKITVTIYQPVNWESSNRSIQIIYLKAKR